MNRKNIKKTVFVLALLLSHLLAQPLSAKTADSTYVMPWHCAFVEVGGASDFIGIDYDMRLSRTSRWGFRTGVSWAYQSESSYSETKENYVGFSTEMNYLIGGRRNHLELGIGNKLWLIKYELKGGYYNSPFAIDGGETQQPYSCHKTWVRDFIYLNIGYRHEALHGFQFRCGATPMINVTNGWYQADGKWIDQGDIFIAPYVSFGWAF